MTRTLCGIFFGIVITREEFKEVFEDELDALFKKKKKKSMEDIDDFLDDAKGLMCVQKALLPKGATLILSSDHYDRCHDKADDLILGIELKVVDIRRKRGPTTITLSSRKQDEFTEFLLASSIEKTPTFILRAPV